MSKRKKVLIVAYHFPPYSGGSGVHRASKFARYLPENGWVPHILTTSSLAYEKVDWNIGDKVAPDLHVTRAFALDAQKHLAFRGRYIGATAIPDRWANWALAAVPAGLWTIYSRKIDVIFVTFPIASAVFIAWALHRLTGKPLVVDFRDSMTEDDYPRDPKVRQVYRWLEKRVVEGASQLIFTTRSTREMYLKRHPELKAGHCVVIANGFDEEEFAGVLPAQRAAPSGQRRLRLVHAGLIYREERDPRPFFRALQRLKSEGTVGRDNLQVDLRASGSEDYYAQLLREMAIDDIVALLPALPHREALRDTANADGLLLFQAANCNHQIPAKVYEYLKLARPVFALTDDGGDTAALLRDAGGATIAGLDDEEALYQAFPGFLHSLITGTHPLPRPEKVQGYTRRNGTRELAHCLDRTLSADTPAAAPRPVEKEEILR